MKYVGCTSRIIAYMKYYCNKCGSGQLSYLRTGELMGSPYHSGRFAIHTSNRPSKPINGTFLNTGIYSYQIEGAKIGQSGFVEVESGGGVNAYYDFGIPIGTLYRYGAATRPTSLGKAVLIGNSNEIHWFPTTGYNSISGICATCGTRLF
jgi:hypothetical protein